MRFEKTLGFVENTNIPMYFNENLGNYVRSSDVPDKIKKHLRGITCIMNDDGETMIPVVDITDVIRYGKPTD